MLLGRYVSLRSFVHSQKKMQSAFFYLIHYTEPLLLSWTAEQKIWFRAMES
jgi:hypothetical protein